MLSIALAGLRARGRRTLLSAAGVLAASLVVGTGVTVGYGLATGFDRSADRADLPDVIARFDDESRDLVDERVRALPNLAAAAYRYERLNADLRANGRHTDEGAIQVVHPGRRGYAIVEGRDLGRAPGEVVVERGLAREWDLRPGDTLSTGRGLGELTVAGSPSRPTTSPTRWPRPPACMWARRRSRSGSGSCPTPRTSRCCGSTTRERPT